MGLAFCGQRSIPGRRPLGGRLGQLGQPVGELPGAALTLLPLGLEVVKPGFEGGGLRVQTGNLRGADFGGPGALVEECGRASPTRPQVANFPGGLAKFEIGARGPLPKSFDKPLEGPKALGPAGALRAEGVFRGGVFADAGEEFLASRRLFGNAEHPCLFRGFPDAARGSGIAPRHPDVPVQFAKPFAHALERLFGRPQVCLALPSIQAVGAEPNRLVDQQPQIGGLAAEHVVGTPLLDQRVRPGAESGTGEQPPDLSPGAPPAVHFVNGLSTGVHPAADNHVPPETTGRHAVFRRRFGGAVARYPGRRAPARRTAISGSDNGSGSVGGDAVFGIPRSRIPGSADVEPHFGDPEGLTQSTPAEDEFLPPCPDGAGAQLTEHPEDRVCDVALAATVRPHHRRGPLPELERHRFGEALESGDLEPLDPHSLVTWKIVAAALPNPGVLYAVAEAAHNMLCSEGAAPPRYGGSAIRNRGWEPSLPNAVPRVCQQP